MRICFSRTFFVALLVVVSSCAAIGQQPNTLVWQTLVSSGSEFSVAVPADYLVNQNKRWPTTTIVGGGGGSGFSVTFQKTSNGREMLKRSQRPSDSKGTFSKLSTRDLEVRVYSYEGSRVYRKVVLVGTRKGSYALTVEASGADNPALSGILASVRVNAQALDNVGGGGEAPAATSSVIVTELPNSEIVREAHKRGWEGSIRYEVSTKDYGLPDTDVEVVYSRPLLVVEQPPAKFTDEARTNNIQGEVRLRIHFKADGGIDKIVVLKSLPFGLTEQAMRAASQIRFVPAEVAGKQADSQATREYRFAIY